MAFLEAHEQTEALTGAAPTGADEGVEISPAAKSYRITISASTGATLSGAGDYQLYYRNTAGLWGLDPRITGSVTNSGVRTLLLEERELGPGCGRMRLVFTGLTTSDSLPVRTRYEFGT